jgi:uncharacterized phiE125 gp8 family phage protein
MIDYYPYSWPWYRSFLSQRSLRLVTPASAEHITLEQARQHLRLDTYGSPPSHPDDGLLETVYIPAARAICEAISGRAFAVQTYEVGLGAFGGYPYAWVEGNRVKLGLGPVRGITSVIYSDGTTDTTLDGSSYLVDSYTEGGYIYPAYGTTWPSAAAVPNAVRVRFTAGYDVAGASPYEFPLPADYMLAMYLALGHVYENRENTSTLDLKEIPMGIQAILGPSSLVNGFA